MIMSVLVLARLCTRQVLDKDGKVVPHVYCIGDANGKYMLAHAASAQVRSRARVRVACLGGRRARCELAGTDLSC